MNDFSTKLPEIKFNKTGYEIRTEILSMAMMLTQSEFDAKYSGWEYSIKREPTTGQAVASLNMPQYPGVEQILETAEKLYTFVNQNTKRSKD